jgi:hypothetical protein
MANPGDIPISNNFQLNAELFIDGRNTVADVATLASLEFVPDGFECFVQDVQLWYQYVSGVWDVRPGGGSVVSVAGTNVDNTDPTNPIVEDFTSAQIVTNAADTYSLTLADTVSSNHYLFLQTASGDPFVDVTVTSYANPKDGAILVIKLARDGTDDLTIPGFSAGTGFQSGVYTARYSASEASWLPINYLPLTVSTVEDFTDLGDVPSTYSGQANKVVKVNAAANGLEFGQEVYNLKVSLSAAQIKTANSVPIDVGLPASGAGFYYRVTAFDCKIDFGTVAFVTNGLSVISVGGSGSAVYTNNVVDSTFSNFLLGFPNQEIATETNLVENSTLSIVGNLDSAVGDSTVDCYITVVKVAL